ncbi:hypothetical protein EG329_007444 [Mollisiaceae sp. DMI_Dod_QoI]|nr:hypothetical protein EG329_007444 [Helotiales sp. DMI_Dod_QoI]
MISSHTREPYPIYLADSVEITTHYDGSSYHLMNLQRAVLSLGFLKFIKLLLTSSEPSSQKEKMKPHQRKTGNKEQKPQTENVDPNRPLFFYMPNEPPYGLFCQWHKTSFEVSLASLNWLRTVHPNFASKVIPTDEQPATFTFNCAEQFMMYCKAVYFSDPESGAKILDSTDPKEQKALGRQVEGWDESIWRQVCERVAFEGNWWKFSGGEKEKQQRRRILLGTGERELCEASTKDRRWGIGYREKHAMKYRKNWGENLLGKALTRVREKLRERVKDIEDWVRSDWDLPGEEMWDDEEEHQ